MIIQFWKNHVKSNEMLRYGIEILDKILEIGNEKDTAYIVGGTPRDLITKEKDPDDIDICTSVDVNILENHFETHSIGKNKEFSIIVINYKGYNFEVSNYRKDGNYSDNRHPDDVELVDSFKEDAERRDFTINALAVDRDGNVIDHFNGLGDLKKGLIRAIGDPKKRFKEDFLRLIRAVRFSSRLGFDIEYDTFYAIKKLSSNIKKVSNERIYKELCKMANQSGIKFANAIELLEKTELLDNILPELYELKKFQHNIEFHPEASGNVFGHVIEALKMSESIDSVVNLAILFHDVGKSITFSTDEDGNEHYYKHHLDGLVLIDSICDRLKIDNKSREVFKFCCLNHMVIHDFLKVSKSKSMKLIDDKNWNNLLKVAKADSMSRGSIFDSKEWIKIEDRVGSLREWFKDKQAVDNIRKVVNGHLVMELRPDIEPSPFMGEVIKTTVDWILDTQIDIEKDLDVIKEFIKYFKLTKVN